MRFLTYSICVLAGLATSVVVVAMICAQAAPPALARPADLATPVSASPPSALTPGPEESQPQLPKLKEPDAARRAELPGGPEVVAIVEGANRVTSVKLIPGNWQLPPSTYEAATPEAVLDAKTATRVKTALSHPEGIQVGGTKPCGPPGFGWRLSFHAGARRVDIYFCLRCAVLVVFLDGNSAGGAAFDPVERELKTIYDSLGYVDRPTVAAEAPDDPFADPTPVRGVP